MPDRRILRWGVQWRSDCRLDGRRRYFLWDQRGPLLFHTRALARQYIRETYGYIAEREDLRREPYGWKMPAAVRVVVTLEAA